LEGTDGVGSVSEQALMARALQDAATLDRPVREVMDPPFPVVDADWPLDRLSALLSRQTPAALVRRDSQLTGIVTRYDLLHHLAPRGSMRITVLTGGATVERTVAFAGAAQVVAALRGRGHVAAVVDIATGLLTEDVEKRLLRTEVGTALPDVSQL